jgi:hypothetical protein
MAIAWSLADYTMPEVKPFSLQEFRESEAKIDKDNSTANNYAAANDLAQKRIDLDTLKYNLEAEAQPAKLAETLANTNKANVTAQDTNLELGDKVHTRLAPLIDTVLNEPDERKKQENYRHLYDTAKTMGVDPDQLGYSREYTPEVGKRLLFYKENAKRAAEAAQAKTAGAGVREVRDPITKKPVIVTNAQAVGQQPYVAPKPLSVADAGKVAGINLGLKDLEQARQIYMPNGEVNRSITLTPSILPFTQKKTASEAMLRAINAKLRADTGADAPQHELEQYKTMFFPTVGDDDEAIKNKFQSLDAWMRSTIDLSGVPEEDRNRILVGKAREIIEGTSPKRVEEFKRDHPELANRSDEEIHALILNKITPREQTASAPLPDGYFTGRIKETYPAGQIAAIEESNRNPGSVAKDSQGWSYGTFQLNTEGRLNSFLRKSGYSSQFSGLKPGTEAFNNKWKSVAKDDPDFKKAQESYVVNDIFNPLATYAQKKGFNPKDPLIQEALISIGVQHSGSRKVVDLADKFTQKGMPPLKALYQARGLYVARLANLSPALKKKQLDRYSREYRNLMSGFL